MVKKIKEKFSQLRRVSEKTLKPVQAKVGRAFARIPKKQLQVILTLVILTAGISTAVLLKFSRKAPARVEKVTVAPLVKVLTVRQQDVQMVVSGYGTVQPKVEAQVVPQVSGKVVDINPNFKNGGFIKAGQFLVIVDPCDYELNVRRAQAQVAGAQVTLELEQAEPDVARHVWEQLNPGKEPASPLVIRQPQIRQAQTRLHAAKAELAAAKLNLERTKVSLPFDGRVVAETVDLGQYVMTGQSIGKVYGIDTAEIEVPLEDWELAWFDIPGRSASKSGAASRHGAEAEVRAQFAGGNHSWKGYVVRTTGEVDKTSRLVSVVVEVPEPFKTDDSRPPLVPGMFVEVLIKGRTLKKVIPVARAAVRTGNKIWTVNNSRLHIKELRIARQDSDWAYVVSGLEDGTVIVTSSLDVVTEGMTVRTENDDVRKTN